MKRISRDRDVWLVNSVLISIRMSEPMQYVFFFSSRRRHTRCGRDWSSDCALPIFEIDVDAFRADRGKLFRKVTRAMVDGGVEAKFLGDIAAFFRAASDTDGPGAGHLGELPDERADRAACSRDNNRLALVRLADEIEPGIGGEAGHA